MHSLDPECAHLHRQPQRSRRLPLRAAPAITLAYFTTLIRSLQNTPAQNAAWRAPATAASSVTCQNPN